jgi:hypothetical protein
VFLPSTAPLTDLRAFVFGDHALKLHQKLILRRRSKDLIGVLSTQSIWRIDQHGGDLALAYRLNNRTVIRTGYGISYDPLPMSRVFRDPRARGYRPWRGLEALRDLEL